MKKVILLLVLVLTFTTTSEAFAKTSNTHTHYNRYHSSSSNGNRAIIVKSDYISDEHNFANCKDHVLLSDTIINFYSDGRKSTYTKYTIKNTDGTILQEDCYNVKHIIYNKKHYFLFRKNKKYNIMDAKGTIISSKKYKLLDEIAPNRILTSINKKYGVIDIDENIIVPIKYKSFEQVGKNLYITKLNGYYGIMNCNNDIFIK
ncbi:WG repeat-containing protein, partial [bacterium]|nr:WG repeat-containing protein [bacterium]